jgi:predicted DNA-binding protein (MmcQ/YjbR family)
MASRLQTAHDRLLAHALTLPEAAEDFPWGERVVKVRGKIFLFLGVTDEGSRLYVGVKLPESNEEALAEPGASRMGYGLGKHGWVSLSFARADRPPVDVLTDYVTESYRAVAPKRLGKLIDPT